MPTPFFEIDGLRPVVHPMAYVHPSAVVIGDVLIEEGVYVGPNASLRGDFGRLVLARGSNVQDCCVLHAFPGEMVHVGEAGHVGHSAVLHGCKIERHAMVGIGAVVMDNAVVGEAAIVGAKALVPAGFDLPARHLAFGAPARVVRPLTAEEIDWKREGTFAYQRLVGRSRESLRPCEPLGQEEEGRLKIEEIHPQEQKVMPKTKGL